MSPKRGLSDAQPECALPGAEPSAAVDPLRPLGEAAFGAEANDRSWRYNDVQPIACSPRGV